MNTVPAMGKTPSQTATPALLERVGRTLGVGFVVALPLAMWIANRSSPLMLGLAAAGLLAAALLGEGLHPVLARLRGLVTSPIGLALTVFLVWALVSLAWSHRPAAGLAAWGELALPLFCGVIVVASRQMRPDATLWRALALTLVAACCLILLELATGLSQRLALGLGKGIERTDIFNRPVLTGLFLTVAVLPNLWPRRPGAFLDRALCLLLALAVCSAIWFSESGAAKLGLLVLAAIWIATRFAPRLMLAAVALGFAATMLLAPVFGELVDRAIPASVHQKLADTHSRDRVDIWLSFGEAIRARPLIGSGFGATAALENHPVAAAVSAERRAMLAVGHPHSAPLQAWAETGLVGAALLAFAGLACLARLRGLPARDLAPRLALFAAAFAVASIGHGAWQGWWIAALVLAVVLLQPRRTGARGAPDEEGHGHG